MVVFLREIEVKSTISQSRRFFRSFTHSFLLLLSRQEARSDIESTIRVFSEGVPPVDKPNETGRETDDFLEEMDRVKGVIPVGFRGALDCDESTNVSKVLAAAVGSSRNADSAGVRDSVGGGASYISSRIDTLRIANTKMTAKPPKISKSKCKDVEVEVEQEPQESLPEWEDWSVEGEGKVDKATILKTLASALQRPRLHGRADATWKRRVTLYNVERRSGTLLARFCVVRCGYGLSASRYLVGLTLHGHFVAPLKTGKQARQDPQERHVQAGTRRSCQEDQRGRD